MSVRKAVRRGLGVLLALTMGAAGATVPTAPAVAAVTYPFAINDVWGHVTFRSDHSYEITASVYNPYPRGSVGFWTRGEYFVGAGRYFCGSTSHRSNYVYDTIKVYSNLWAGCSHAAVDVVYIVETSGGGHWAGELYLDNPYR